MDVWVDVINGAFDLMGEPTIASLDDAGNGTLAQRAARRVLEDARYILRQRRWPWTERSQVMSKDSDSAGDYAGYSWTLKLPADCVRVNAVYAGAPGEADPRQIFYNPRVPWNRIGSEAGPGGAIGVIGPSPVTVFFNALPEKPAALSPEIRDVIAARVAWALSKAQSESSIARERARTEMEQAYRAAAMAAMAEGDPHNYNANRSNWIDAMASGTI